MGIAFDLEWQEEEHEPIGTGIRNVLHSNRSALAIVIETAPFAAAWVAED